MEKIHFITLGCSKNTFDTNIMSEILISENYEISDDVYDSDYIVVNTCGFIESAKKESIDTIMEVLTLESDRDPKIILTGCLAERYKDELLKEIPEVDAIIGTGGITSISDVVESLKNTKGIIIDKDINTKIPEVKRTYSIKAVEYVKISEGCDNNCTYCIIPALRGRNRSRSIEDITSEIMNLVENGTKEVVLIAQNTTDYGIDIYGKRSLSELISAIDKIDKDFWVRILYMYPDGIDEKLLTNVKNSNKILHYFDIPLQHASDSVLKRMNRKITNDGIKNLINRIRAQIPDSIIRTTFIVGFPGETEDEFNDLYNLVNSIKFDRVGVFTYSREEDTPAYNMKNQLTERKKNSRRDKIMALQQKISSKKLTKFIGNCFNVLIDEVEDQQNYIGRTYMDAEEIDGIVYVESDKQLDVGTFYKVEITDSLDYDLIGRVVQ